MKPGCTGASFSFLLPGVRVQPAAISRLPPSKGPCPKPQESHRPTEANSYSRPHGHMATPTSAGTSIFLSHVGPFSLPVVPSHLPAPATPTWCLNESAGQKVIWGQIRRRSLKSEGAKRRRLLCLAGGGMEGFARWTGAPSRGEKGQEAQRGPTAGACRAAHEGDGEPQDSEL